jgi:hypothetical protein
MVSSLFSMSLIVEITELNPNPPGRLEVIGVFLSAPHNGNNPKVKELSSSLSSGARTGQVFR